MTSDTIPFLNLIAAHRELKEELLTVFETALDTSGFVGGQWFTTTNTNSVSSVDRAVAWEQPTAPTPCGLPWIAAGVRPGDTVATVPLSFIAATEAISQAGAQPDFVDLDEGTHTIDPE